jgi:pimeloyl-ACP methyl ester carboxylesterase
MKTLKPLKILILAVIIAALPLLAFAQVVDPASLAGTWKGALDLPGQKLPIVFHLVYTDGQLSATWDSPAQGAMGLATKSVFLDDLRVSIDIPVVAGEYVGTLEPGLNLVKGTWKQGGGSMSLDLERDLSGVVASGPKRPQTPVQPYPYTILEATISGGAGGNVLSGTLTIPAGPGPFPAVVLVTGSGPQDRDEFIMGHKPFHVIADYLTRRGIAVFRYDDRGVASSTGDYGSATSLDFADDAQAALAWLSERSEVDPARVGIAGHSEGGLIAPIVASRDKNARFIIMLAGPGMKGSELVLLQSAAISRASGVSEAQIVEVNALNAKLYAAAVAPGTESESAARVRALYKQFLDERPGMTEAARQKAMNEFEPQVTGLLAPWMRTFLALDPAPYLAKVAVPTLAVIGSVDLQVPVEENLAAISKIFKDSGHESLLTTRRIEGLNHLFQHSATGLPSDYAMIEETFAPEVLALMADWINALPR